MLVSVVEFLQGLPNDFFPAFWDQQKLEVILKVSKVLNFVSSRVVLMTEVAQGLHKLRVEIRLVEKDNLAHGVYEFKAGQLQQGILFEFRHHELALCVCISKDNGSV